MNKSNALKTALSIKGLEIEAYLGWPENERLKIQTVVIDIDVQLPTPPPACQTDKLEDTLCYKVLIDEIHEKITPRHFFLIEHLSAELYRLIKPHFKPETIIHVRVTKRPKLKGLTGGVCFHYGDA